MERNIECSSRRATRLFAVSSMKPRAVMARSRGGFAAITARRRRRAVLDRALRADSLDAA